MSTTTLNVEIDQEIMTAASAVLAADDLTVSAFVHRALTYISIEKRQPSLDCLTPGPETVAAMEAVERGEVETFSSIDALMADLNADD